MEVNVDDIVIKSNVEEEIVTDIKETLDGLRAINLKLNPKKCSFGVEEGILSGHLITKQGIKASPSKVNAISDLQPPKYVSEIQNLNKKLAALNPFLSKGADKTLLFMCTLKSCTSGKMVQWTAEADKAFRRMKDILADFLAKTPSKEEEGAKDEEAKRKNQSRKKHGNCSLMELQALTAPEQVNGLFEARQTVIKQYLEKSKELLANFPCHSIEHAKRDQNKKADALSKLASMIFSKLAKEVLVEVIQDKSITQKEVADVTQEKEDSWMIPIREYLQLGKLLDDPQKARKL
ncbi:reverse transcriptase domain-containing protein [Tanacetum coccineum]